MFANVTQAPVQVMHKHHASHPMTSGSVRPPPADTRAHGARRGDGTHTPAGGGWDPQGPPGPRLTSGPPRRPRLRTRILGYLRVPATNRHVAGGPSFPPSCKPCAFLHHCPRNHPAPCTPAGHSGHSSSCISARRVCEQHAGRTYKARNSSFARLWWLSGLSIVPWTKMSQV